MVPFIVSQSRESTVAAPEGFLIQSRQADIEFFLKRGIPRSRYYGVRYGHPCSRRRKVHGNTGWRRDPYG